MKTWGAALAVALSCCLAFDGSEAKEARCHIESSGTAGWDGPCTFVLDGRNGSFTVSALARRELISNVATISVTIVDRDVAQVRSLTSSGVNSRWGEARRSPADRACWIGADFKICAY